MNFYHSKPTAVNSTAKKPTVTKRTVQIVRRLSDCTGQRPASGAPARPRDTTRFKLSARPNGSCTSRPASKIVAKRAIEPRGTKRKSQTPDRVEFSDEEDGASSSDVGGSESDAASSRKRVKSSVSSVESSRGPRRQVLAKEAFRDGAEHLSFIHGADATSGAYAAKYKNPWDEQEFVTVELQYPSKSPRERFELKWPKNEQEDYRPMEDIIETIKHIIDHYFPSELAQKHRNVDTGFERRFNHAWTRQDIPGYLEVVEEFNAVVKSLVDDGTIQRKLAAQDYLDLDLVRRILDQTYARTVSPKVESLRAYENGTDFVYGELLPRFVSKIFEQTGLNHESIFVDLGSGVGNVALQAALEVGCESWGIEQMSNPCDLAEQQAIEFPARARLWGLDVGKVHLLRGDFTADPRIYEILKRADVVLVNNQAFLPATNDKLRDMFLDLKMGCQVVSLKPFRPVKHDITMRNFGSVVNTLAQKEYEYFSNNVSWTDQGGTYYIARKDHTELERFAKLMRKKGLR
ncbi:hypothetical protein LTR36_001948 [Oleoguttula mirabilis]|uniref:Histone-lysine N-methyltransferase, H3 lysine-79 specific n=1 Tax=Oleoguttula mirabilis TaxID=1507867 RepID=A0AAV9JL98_9PEZI|nr:hypothetical protein LTR36_001948 [Oleoguttula mirabilis]